jgi:hypothetical protein
MPCELDKTEICHISNCITDVKGKGSNSASPTDVWLVEFKAGTTYKGEEVDSAFLKLFIDPSSLHFIDEYKSSPILRLLLGLNYEIRVYKDIIRPLLDLNICPNFVKFLASSESCRYDDILNFLIDHVSIGRTLLTDDQVRNILNKNIQFCLLEKCKKRESIQTEINTYFPPPNENIRYNMLLNESIDVDTVTFSRWLDYILKEEPVNTDLFWMTLFQIVAACYSMSLSKMTHNDLHADNIFIKKLDSETCSLYVIDEIPYIFKCSFKVLIYDFDRSYVERFGNNEILKGESTFSNRYIENKDIMKSLCYVYKYLQYYSELFLETELLSCLTNVLYRENLLKMFDVEKCFIDVEDLGLYNSTSEILKNIGNKLPTWNAVRVFSRTDTSTPHVEIGTLSPESIMGVQYWEDFRKLIDDNISYDLEMRANDDFFILSKKQEKREWSKSGVLYLLEKPLPSKGDHRSYLSRFISKPLSPKQPPKLRLMSCLTDGNIDEIYVCNSEFFNTDGSIDLDKHKEIYDEVLARKPVWIKTFIESKKSIDLPSIGASSSKDETMTRKPMIALKGSYGSPPVKKNDSGRRNSVMKSRRKSVRKSRKSTRKSRRKSGRKSRMKRRKSLRKSVRKS